MELLERELPFAQLEEHMRQAAAGHGRLVLIGGEAGIGKSALLDAFHQGIADETTVLRASCDALSTPAPLGPVRDLAPALGLSIGEQHLDRDAQERLFRDVLAALSDQGALTVVIWEDAHWADAATLDLIRFLGRRVDGRQTLHLVTYRDDEIGPDHPLRLILGDLATARSIHRMTLHPLTDAAVQQLARGSGRDMDALYRQTGGNPFFLNEVLAAPGQSVPASAADAVLARASRLSPEARATLDVAAVIGSVVDADLLLAVAGPVADEVDACIARGLLLGKGEHLTFRHELAREAILSALAPTRRRLLHARVLSTLRELPETSRDLARMAHHAEAAGDRQAVLAYAVAAGKQASAFFSHREAAAQYARALRFGDALPPAERAALLEARSVACYLGDQGEEAIAARRMALEIWQRLGDARREGECLRWLSHLAWRGSEAAAAAQAALERLEPLPPGPELAMAYSNLAQLHMLDHDLPGTLQWGTRAISLAEELGETETLVHALNNVGSARAYAGDAEGRDDLKRSLQLSRAAGLIDHAGRALANLAYTAMLAMQLDEAELWLASALAFASKHDLDSRSGYLVATRAALHVLRGEWDGADTELGQLLERPMLSTVTRMMALTTWGALRARRGEAEATACLDEALALADDTGKLLRQAPIRAARAEAALLAGDAPRARAEIEAVREAVFARANPWDRGRCAWLLWQAGERDVPLDGLADPFARQIAGDWAGSASAWRTVGDPYAEACALASGDDPNLIRQAAGTFERLGAFPAHRQAIQRLRVLGERDLPVVRRGPIATTRSNPAGLTQREVEVLVLVAEGLRNPEIAERLYLSPKTVSHHLSTILAKLNAETRTEAAQVAAKMGLLPA
jgi:DNA-binding CsgD family transcriptional regulator/tetratricopeptide (TPR) repeat protein